MKITTKQMFIAVAIVAGFSAALARGHQLLGSHGLSLFSMFSVATLILAFFLFKRWRKSSSLARLVRISIVCLPLIPIAVPRLVMTDFDHMADIAKKERSAGKLNQILLLDSRFHNVSVRYKAPSNQKGQWLAVSGSVATIRDFETLQGIVHRADEWHVESSVSVSEDSLRKLSSELRQAERRIARLEKLLKHAEASGFHSDLKTLSSGVSMIKQLPKHLVPKKLGSWSQAELVQVNEFLTDNFVGRDYAFRAKIRARSSHLYPTSVKRTSSQPKYICTIEFDNPVTPNTGFTFVHRLKSAYRALRGGKISFTGDEDFSKMFLAEIRPKSFFIVEGKIYRISVAQLNNQITFDITLSNKRYTPSRLEDGNE